MPTISLQRAFSLLELLFVLVCITAIVLAVMHHYQIQERRAQTIQIQSDVKSLQRALDHYFHETGCDKEGNFTAAVNCQDLEKNEDVVCSRAPLVTEYKVSVNKTDQVTKTIPAKPIYQLQVQAIMNSALTDKQRTWYQQQLRAELSADASSGTLTWISLPNNSYVQLGDGSWVLNGDNAFFRSTENERSASTNLSEYSGSYCAN